MPVQFTCPHCGLQTNVADEYAGRSGPCARCGKPITVPPLSTPFGYAPPAQSRGSGWAIVAAIVGGGVMVMLVCGGILGALMLPAVQAAREAARRAQCVNNLKQIGLAMHNYHTVYGCFPPAYIPDAKGRPMHSWRVLLLPYMEQRALYSQYRFDEPWDGPHNRVLANAIVAVYRCPSHPAAVNPQATDYVMIVGPDTFSDGPTPRRISDITDGTSNTIMLVEIANSDIPWLEPRDLDATSINFAVNDPSGKGIGSKHPGGVNVLMVDASVRFFSDSVDPKLVRTIATIADGGAVGPF